jgi:hypothetical protein
MFSATTYESFATYASALSSSVPQNQPNKKSPCNDATGNNPLLLEDDDTTTTAAAAEPLALNSHMDWITITALLRLPPHPYLHLSLYRVELDYNISHEIIDQLHRCHTIQLDYCDGDYIHEVISHCLSLKTVTTISFCGALSQQVLNAFCDGLGRSQLDELRLTVDMPTEVVQAFGMAINQCESLQKLDLSQCEFGGADEEEEDAIGTLCEVLQQNTTLHTLHLSSCRLEDDEVAQVATALCRHPCLRELSFRMNYAQDEAIDAISNHLIRHTPSLQSLDLAQQNPGVLDLEILALALGANNTLQTLNLQENFLHDAHVQALVTAMTKNTTLRELNLENCELGHVGCSKLLDGLGQFRGITKLWLKENKFSQSAVSVPADGCTNDIAQNLTLQVLDLDDDIVLPDHVKQVLEWNRGGRQSLTPNAVPLSLWPTILARVHRIFPNEEDPETQPSSKGEGQEEATKESNASASSTSATTTAVDILYYMLQGPALFER